MKALAAIGLIMAFIAETGVICMIWVMAWLAFEETRLGHEITQKIREKLYRRRY